MNPFVIESLTLLATLAVLATGIPIAFAFDFAFAFALALALGIVSLLFMVVCVDEIHLLDKLMPAVDDH